MQATTSAVCKRRELLRTGFSFCAEAGRGGAETGWAGKQAGMAGTGTETVGTETEADGTGARTVGTETEPAGTEAKTAQAGTGGMPKHVQGRVRQDRLGTGTARLGSRAETIRKWDGPIRFRFPRIIQFALARSSPSPLVRLRRTMSKATCLQNHNAEKINISRPRNKREGGNAVFYLTMPCGTRYGEVR